MSTGARFQLPVLGGKYDDASLHRNFASIANWLARPFQQGLSRARVRQTTDLNVANNTDVELNFNNVEVMVDTDAFVDIPGDAFVVPFDGLYLWICSVRWGVDTTGQRKLEGFRTPQGGSLTSVADLGMIDTGSAIAGYTTTLAFAHVIPCARFDALQMYVRQNSGVSKDVNDWNASILYVGPS